MIDGDGDATLILTSGLPLLSVFTHPRTFILCSVLHIQPLGGQTLLYSLSRSHALLSPSSLCLLACQPYVWRRRQVTGSQQPNSPAHNHNHNHAHNRIPHTNVHSQVPVQHSLENKTSTRSLISPQPPHQPKSRSTRINPHTPEAN